MWSLAAGVLAVATLPLAIFATRYSRSYDLLQAGFAIPIAAALGVAAVALAGRARTRDALSLGRAGGLGAARAGRILGILALCLGCSAAISLAVYGLLLSIA
ncbi:hypothetical protein Gocc_0925 [Gaiella occulta]|uniref:Uncharacterized protein n=1 Tax=Gaiella occulta TaxID=1002870 RepID=A0A7M2YY98_9ACTN|nr:hypothetical protein [Gaiella occulta]RDI75127.1 hypothetical protein Gocc_0925 [Gaiella occulta]